MGEKSWKEVNIFINCQGDIYIDTSIGMIRKIKFSKFSLLDSFEVEERSVYKFLTSFQIKE